MHQNCLTSKCRSGWDTFAVFDRHLVVSNHYNTASTAGEVSAVDVRVINQHIKSDLRSSFPSEKQTFVTFKNNKIGWSNSSLPPLMSIKIHTNLSRTESGKNNK